MRVVLAIFLTLFLTLRIHFTAYHLNTVTCPCQSSAKFKSSLHGSFFRPPQTVFIWLTVIDQNFEQIGRPLPLRLPIDTQDGEMIMSAREAILTILRDIDYYQLTAWKINNPVRLPSKRQRTSTESNETLLTLLDDIRRSSNLSSHAQLLEDLDNIVDYFEEDRENRVQAIILCACMSIIYVNNIPISQLNTPV